MFNASRVFFAFSSVTDPTKHRDYNEWHSLYCQPEYLALPGVLHSQRWVSSPDCVNARTSCDPAMRSVHYMTMYWLREPMERTIQEFTDLTERMHQLGQMVVHDHSMERQISGFFVPVKGFANPRVLVSPEALPFRPNRGVIVSVADMVDPDGPQVADVLEWFDNVHVPDVISCKGVAGAWTFMSDPSYGSPGGLSANPKGRMIRVYYMDGDPLESDIAARVPEWKAAGRMRDMSNTQKMLFSGPMRAMVPWQRDWFE